MIEPIPLTRASHENAFTGASESFEDIFEVVINEGLLELTDPSDLPAVHHMLDLRLCPQGGG
jgi:hypothetical protein